MYFISLIVKIMLSNVKAWLISGRPTAILRNRWEKTTEDYMVNASESVAGKVNSQSAMFLQVAQLVAEIQQRSSSDTGALLRELIKGAAGSVPGAQYAGITVTKPQRPSETAAATHRYPVVLDVVQHRYRQGPCLSAAAQQDRVRVDDLGTDERWPLYREEALRQTPIRSILRWSPATSSARQKAC
jgi:hypothetical protein